MTLNTDKLRSFAALVTAVRGFDAEDMRRRINDEGEYPVCIDCHEQYHLETGDDPTPLCDACAHDMVTLFAPVVEVALLDALRRRAWICVICSEVHPIDHASIFLGKCGCQACCGCEVASREGHTCP